MSIGNIDRVRNTNSKSDTVYIVDGDSPTRDALESMVTDAGWQTAVAASAAEFMALPRTVAPSCLLLDLNLPGSNGLELQGLIRDHSEIQVIFMSCCADIQAAVQALKAGAFEFLIKPFADEVLLDTIRQAIEQSREEISHLERLRTLEERYESLSLREREVMRLVVSGRLNKQVGADLGISEITVKAHRGRVMRKMQSRSLAELVIMAAYLRLREPVDPAEIAGRIDVDASRRVFSFPGNFGPAVWRHDTLSAWHQSPLAAH
jgi:FixJ family two-component response regulator